MLQEVLDAHGAQLRYDGERYFARLKTGQEVRVEMGNACIIVFEAPEMLLPQVLLGALLDGKVLTWEKPVDLKSNDVKQPTTPARKKPAARKKPRAVDKKPAGG
jgi:hypothetical protein